VVTDAAVQTALPGHHAKHRTAHHDGARPRRSRRRTGRVADVVLAVGALFGLVTAVWLGLAHLTGATVVVLETGSMAPAMPQGTAAVVVPVAAEQLRVGDVVTVRRDDASPFVTHRVVDIAPVEDAPQRRSLTLQGDANTTPDLFPYEVERALRTTYSVPNGAQMTRVMQAPGFRAAVVFVVAAGLVWAFWPASRRPVVPTLRRDRQPSVAGRRRANG
jgi:signal peptidase